MMICLMLSNRRKEGKTSIFFDPDRYSNPDHYPDPVGDHDRDPDPDPDCDPDPDPKDPSPDINPSPKLVKRYLV